ncbi:ATP-binding protein [Actinocorallia longicatena]|uniref:histidine kinase n=1 Tax=Actinocorallia longicatena TaxID=111803 RepID=A0ABP6QCW6_9ACTN
MGEEVLTFELLDEDGIFAVRRAGREVAAAVGLETQDQVRVATALSEVCRESFVRHGRLTLRFLIEPGALVVELRADEAGEGLAAAARLMDEVERVEAGLVRLRKHLRRPGGRISSIRDRIAHLAPVSVLDELRVQNAELLSALEEVRALNTELEETNSGVVALYTQLSSELEETNRGVVALNVELEEKSDQLVAAGEAKNRFWATVSHELRTPVNSVIGLAGLLLGQGADPLTDEQRHQISLIDDSGRTLLALVDELLDMAKAEQGRLDPALQRADVPALLSRLAELLRPTADQSGIELVLDAGDAPPMLFTDELMLTRILRNLLANGLRYTESGEVRLTVELSGGRLLFTVSDTGIGIPQELQELVFEEFYRVPGTIPAGTGLGLPYARRLAEALGGTLTLSGAPGEGTSVVLSLPRPFEPGALGHVLIVDDEDGARRTLMTWLGDGAAAFEEAGTLASALAKAGARKPDLVLLDVRLPDGDGLDLLAVLPDEVPVVLVTVLDTSVLDDRLLARVGVVGKGRLTWPLLAAAVHRAREL